MNISYTLNQTFLDPNRDGVAFWKLLRSYVGRVANKLVAQELLEELTQDCMFQIFTSLDSFEHNPAHKNGSSFTRWVCGIAYRRAQDALRTRATSKTTPFSQVGVWQDGDVWQSTDLSLPEPVLSVADIWPDLVDSTLDDIRASLDPRDLILFDAARRSGSIVHAAQGAGIPYRTARRRLRAMGLAKNPGSRSSCADGIPSSSRPDGRLSIACAAGHKAALAIAESWRFSATARVKLMPAAQFDELARRGYTTHFA